MAKTLLKALGISAAISAQVLLFGPLTSVGGNPNSSLTPAAVLPWSLGLALLSAAILTFVFWLALRRNSRRFVAVSLVFGLWLYVSFYGLMPDFGPFDGRRLDFAGYATRGWLEVGVIVLFLAIALAVPAKVIGPSAFALALLAVVNGGTVLAAVDWSRVGPSTKEARPSDLTAANDFVTSAGRTFGTPRFASGEKNILLIVLDTMQNDVFERMLKEHAELASAFSGFTAFTNASGHFPFTKLSIAAVLRGEVYDGSKPIPDYIAETNSRRLPAVLDQKGYEIDILPLHSRQGFLAASPSECRSYAELADLYLFRQAPVLFKAAVYGDGQFVFARNCPGAIPVTEQGQDLAVLKLLTEKLSADRDAPTFKWMHLWGMHPPARLDKQCQTIKSRFDAAAIQEQAYCILTQLSGVFQKMKDTGVYDNTQIFVISDHGSLLGLLNDAGSSIPPAVRSSAHPSLVFKDYGATGPAQFSSAPVMLSDIYQTIVSSADDSLPKAGLFAISEDTAREREYSYFKSAREASNDWLSKADNFIINGNIRAPKAWTAVAGRPVDLPLSRVDFGTPEAFTFAGLAFSTEAKGVDSSWVLSSPATVSGRLPNSETIRISARFLSPHPEQSVTVKVNDRTVGQWNAARQNSFDVYEVTAPLLPEERDTPSTISFEIGKIEVVSDPARPLGIYVDWIEVSNSD